ncbi:unnamed protein product [Penicillium nalgiovense]|nr:unnamed protein product [Penicillium nalgiovense]
MVFNSLYCSSISRLSGTFLNLSRQNGAQGARGKYIYLRKIDVAALLSLAYSIRGKECSCDENQRPNSGSLNWNDINVPYILMSKASGVPLSTYQWEDDMASPPGIGDRPQAILSTTQKRKILGQLGVLHAALSNIRFSEIG